MLTLNLFSWSSEKNYQKLSTHTLITVCGYELLRSYVMFLSPQIDTSILQRTLDEIENDANWKELLSGSVAPDYGSRNYPLYQDHFWDPDTNENFTFTNLTNIDPQHYPMTHTAFGDLFKNSLTYIADTAETRVREYFAESVYLWKIGEHERALYYLGMASHYLQDICCPVHSSNTIAVLDYVGQHVEFESFVENLKESYTIKSVDIKVDSLERDQLDHSWYLGVIGSKYIADILRELCIVCGKSSKNIIAHYANGSPFNEPVFNRVAVPTMATAQKAESILIFSFVYAVNTDIKPLEEATEFTVTISTRDGKWTDHYGTDNAIFLGIEFNDGRIFEKYCGMKRHNVGGRDSYSMEFRGEKGENVRKIWVRKARILPFADGWIPMAESNWCPSSILLTSSDKGVNF